MQRRAGVNRKVLTQQFARTQNTSKHRIHNIAQREIEVSQKVVCRQCISNVKERCQVTNAKAKKTVSLRKSQDRLDKTTLQETVQETYKTTSRN